MFEVATEQKHFIETVIVILNLSQISIVWGGIIKSGFVHATSKLMLSSTGSGDQKVENGNLLSSIPSNYSSFLNFFNFNLVHF